jgi:endo-1,4-beta-mannosidase
MVGSLQFLSTKEVKDGYGFDPTPYSEKSNPYFIFNKLDGDLKRVWLLSDIERNATAIQARRSGPESIRERIVREVAEKLRR